MIGKGILFIAAVFLLTFCYSCSNKPKSINGKPYLIMLSLDGFRWDYPKMADTPVLDSLKKVGVSAESLKPSFPTKTFPNHYTLATGLYPDHHGIVENNFYAPDLLKNYAIGNREAVMDGRFYGGEPIWVTAEKQGVRSATLFWVGSEAEIKGIRPSICYPYDESMTFTQRIDSISTWLNYPEHIRPHLIMWYYDEPDHIGHEKGPTSIETIEMVEQLDKYLGQFFTEMRKLPIFDQLNFIVLSDHGMGPVDSSHVIYIDKVIDSADIEFIDGWNPDMNIKVKPGKLEKVYVQLKNTPHLFTWKHDSLPARLNYGTNIRTQDITIVAYPGWGIASTNKPLNDLGAHGYDNEFIDMHAIFYAAGPAFKRGYLHPTFENINIYALVAEILSLSPEQTDGNIVNVRSMLAEEK